MKHRSYSVFHVPCHSAHFGYRHVKATTLLKVIVGLQGRFACEVSSSRSSSSIDLVLCMSVIQYVVINPLQSDLGLHSLPILALSLDLHTLRRVLVAVQSTLTPERAKSRNRRSHVDHPPWVLHRGTQSSLIWKVTHQESAAPAMHACIQLLISQAIPQFHPSGSSCLRSSSCSPR